MFLKRKRDRKIKEQTVAGGTKERECISKEEASSPTVATESALLRRALWMQKSTEMLQ
jgi:hypothetical protein